MEKNYQYLDREHTLRLKGLSIILVLISHISVFLLPLKIARLATPLGGIGASMFLFLSGYGLAQSSKRGLSGFWKKRFFTVVLPYLLIWLVLLPISAFRYTGALDFAFDLLAVSPKAEYLWYIGYQIFWYAVYYFIKKMGLVEWANLVLLFGISVLTFGLLPGIYAEKAFAFSLGVLFAHAPRFAAVFKLPWVSAIAFCVGAASLAAKQTSLVRSFSFLPFNAAEALIKMGFMLSFVGAFYYITRLVPWVLPKFISNLSYEIYLSHSVGAVLFYMISGKSTLLAFFVFLAVSAILTAALWAFKRFVTPKLQGVKK